MGEVIDLPVHTTLPLDPDKVLEKAKGEYQKVLILGVSKEGKFLAASSHCEVGELLLLARKFEHKLLSGDYG